MADTEWYYILILVVCIILGFFCTIISYGLMGLEIRSLELLTKGPFETKEDETKGKNA